MSLKYFNLRPGMINRGLKKLAVTLLIISYLLIRGNFFLPGGSLFFPTERSTGVPSYKGKVNPIFTLEIKLHQLKNSVLEVIHINTLPNPKKRVGVLSKGTLNERLMTEKRFNSSAAYFSLLRNCVYIGIQFHKQILNDFLPLKFNSSGTYLNKFSFSNWCYNFYNDKDGVISVYHDGHYFAGNGNMVTNFTLNNI